MRRSAGLWHTASRRECEETVNPEIKSRFIRRPDEEAAKKALLALLCQPLWITRTVESISFVDRHTVRRRISRHYELPDNPLLPKPRGSKDMVRLPVFGIRKGQFISCDLIDESKRSVSLPPLPERSLVSAAALQYLAKQLLNREDKKASERIANFVMAGPESFERELDAARGDSAMKPLFESAHFQSLAVYLAHNYIVFVDVDNGSHAGSAARVIRFELDTRFPHTHRELKQFRSEEKVRPGLRQMFPDAQGIQRRVPRWLRVPLRRLGLMSQRFHHYISHDGAGSLHLDLEAADGIAFGKRRLRFTDFRHPTRSFEAQGASSRRARFLLPRRHGRGLAAMTIDVRPAPGLLRNGAPLLLLGFAALLYGSARHFSDLAGETAAVSLLFLIPGLVSVVTIRHNENPFVTSVLGVPRILAIAPIPLGILAAFVLVTDGSKAILEYEALVAAAFGFILLLGRFIDELKVRPALLECVEDDLTRIG